MVTFAYIVGLYEKQCIHLHSYKPTIHLYIRAHYIYEENT